jgi:hypothetical protein
MFGKAIRPKLKISLFPLNRPTLSKLADWIFFIGNLPSLFFSHFAQNSLCWKFCILDSFRQKFDIFALPSTSLSSKKKKPTYLPTYPLPKLWVGSGETEIFLIVALHIKQQKKCLAYIRTAKYETFVGPAPFGPTNFKNSALMLLLQYSYFSLQAIGAYQI